MKEGSAWTQPPRIKHMILDYSDDVELLEVILPAEFKTVELAGNCIRRHSGARVARTRNPIRHLLCGSMNSGFALRDAPE